MPKPPRALTPEQKRRRLLAVRRWQAKQKAAGRCVTCGRPRAKGDGWHCRIHQKKNRIATVVWREENRERWLSLNRQAGAKRRKKVKAKRAAAGKPVRKWRRKK